MPATVGPSPRRGPTAAPRVRGSAYGLELDADFHIPGMVQPSARGGRTTRLELVGDAAIDEVWRPAEAAEARRMHHPDGSVALTTHRHERLGWLMSAPRYGRHLLDADGSRVRSAPAGVDAARWQLVLTGQVLPAAAALAGLEVLHASAVVVDGRAVAFTGPPGSGKSTLAAHLSLRGASFLTDDVLALEADDGKLEAHPGFAVAGIRDEALPALHRLGAADGGLPADRRAKAQLAFELHPGPAPLRALYLLERAGAGERASVQPLAADPRRLLGSAFSVAIRTPERLARQLATCAAIAAAVPTFAARVPVAGDDELAPRLLEHAAATVRAA